MLDTEITPTDAETEIPLPARILETPYLFNVASVRTTAPSEYRVEAYKSPPTPTPPATINAPVSVEIAIVVVVISIGCENISVVKT